MTLNPEFERAVAIEGNLPELLATLKGIGAYFIQADIDGETLFQLNKSIKGLDSEEGDDFSVRMVYQLMKNLGLEVLYVRENNNELTLTIRKAIVSQLQAMLEQAIELDVFQLGEAIEYRAGKEKSKKIVLFGQRTLASPQRLMHESNGQISYPVFGKG